MRRVCRSARKSTSTLAGLPANGKIQHLHAGMERHRHPVRYLALVLEGGYVERGAGGRWRVESGDVVFHRAFEAHDDVEVVAGTRILNLNVDPVIDLPTVFRLDEPDELAALDLRDVEGLVELVGSAHPKAPLMDAWTDELASALAADAMPISVWSSRHGLSPEHVSRTFRQTHGVSPASFRLEAQVQRAMVMIEDGRSCLADIAAVTGFSDQSHMTRAVTSVTGSPPGRWRRLNSIQDG